MVAGMTIDPCEMEVEPDAVDTLPPQITKGMVVRLKSGGPVGRPGLGGPGGAGVLKGA